jgi:Cu+-exporting ATPase
LRSAYESAADSAGALVCLAVDDRIVGVFPLQEQIREQAKATLEELKRFGLDVAVLTGDHARRAAAVSQLLEAPVHGEMLPDQKVEQLRQDRRRYGPVAMVGDGINDAPALAAADVGIAMACGADVSRHTADVCLLSDDLSRIPWMLTVARQTVRVIRQNLFWAFAYNILAVGFAVTGRLNPVLAAAALVICSAIVVVNSLRLRGKNA